MGDRPKNSTLSTIGRRFTYQVTFSIDSRTHVGTLGRILERTMGEIVPGFHVLIVREVSVENAPERIGN